MGVYGTAIYLVVIVAAMYLLVVRPQQQRSKQMRELIASLEVGSDVITIGGLHGRITWIDDDVVTLRIADGVEIRVDKNAVGKVLGAGDDAGDA
ncbi:MAG: preprotein translocase subunit YajC [Actinomycetota bacterium]|nr:preprotein translocase subunit YajC [Actinomycetota bacterium]